MIREVKIIRQFGRNNRVTEFSYKNYKGGCLTEEFEAMTKDDFELLNKQAIDDKKHWEEVDKRITAQRASMTPEERARWDEADRVVFERWQDEANTNTILDGIVDGEDPDFNPFRKNKD